MPYNLPVSNKQDSKKNGCIFLERVNVETLEVNNQTPTPTTTPTKILVLPNLFEN